MTSAGYSAAAALAGVGPLDVTSGVTRVIARRFLVYTQRNASFARVGAGACARARSSRALRHRLSRLLLPVVPGSRRHPADGAGHPSQGADAVLRTAADARVDRGVLRAVPGRAERGRSVPPQAVFRSPHRSRAPVV